MALYKRSDSKYWWLDFEQGGKRYQLSTKCTNIRAAEKFAAAYKTDVALGKVSLQSKKKPPTFAEAVEDFLAWSKLHNIASTHKKYESASKAPVRFIGAKLIDEIDRDLIEAFVKWRHNQKRKAPVRKLAVKKTAVSKKTIAPATVNKELAFMRILFNRLIDGKKLAANPVARFKFLADESDKMRVLDENEIRLYLVACSQPLQDVANLILETGCRPSELFNLKVKDVNFNTGFFQIVSGKTKAARRKIPMMDKTRAILAARCESSPSEYVFAGGRGGRSDTPILKLTSAHRAAVARSGVKPFRVYDLRHTFATNAVQAGVDLVTLKDLLGHSKLDMVLKYAHPTEAHRAAAMQRISDYRKRA